eukprot:Skav231129  [mRNA]  locus=scaffold7:276789:278103:+ [translate_table: standard]
MVGWGSERIQATKVHQVETLRDPGRPPAGNGPPRDVGPPLVMVPRPDGDDGLPRVGVPGGKPKSAAAKSPKIPKTSKKPEIKKPSLKRSDATLLTTVQCAHALQIREAIQKMVKAGETKNTIRHDMKTFVDTGDLMLRIGTPMFRQLKSDLQKRDLALKRLEPKDQRRLKLVLGQFLLPASYSGEEELENQRDDESQGMQEVKFGQGYNFAAGQLAFLSND